MFGPGTAYFAPLSMKLPHHIAPPSPPPLPSKRLSQTRRKAEGGQEDPQERPSLEKEKRPSGRPWKIGNAAATRIQPRPSFLPFSKPLIFQTPKVVFPLSLYILQYVYLGGHIVKEGGGEGENLLLYSSDKKGCSIGGGIHLSPRVLVHTTHHPTTTDRTYLLERTCTQERKGLAVASSAVYTERKREIPNFYAYGTPSLHPCPTIKSLGQKRQRGGRSRMHPLQHRPQQRFSVCVCVCVCLLTAITQQQQQQQQGEPGRQN